MATLRSELHKFYTQYARKKKTLFIGYNVLYGSRVYGTLEDIPLLKCLETPVAENLMTGLALGYALLSWKPVLCFERHDFLFGGLDILVNHIDKIAYLTNDQVKPSIIIRAVIGDSSTLDVGIQHSQNYTEGLRKILKYTPVIEVTSKKSLHEISKRVGKSPSGAVVAVENRARYDKEIR